MRSTLLAVALAGAVLPLAAAQPAAVTPPPAKPGAPAAKDPFASTKERISYTIGMNIGKDIKRNSIDIDPELLLKGLKDAISGTPLLTEEQTREIMTAFQQELKTKQMETQKAEGEKNKKAGETFLAENKSKEGVKALTVKLPDGKTSELQYKIMNTGTGKKPSTNDTVSTHYRGTLIDGTEFDSSYKRGEPAKFPVTGVIKGWTEALLNMPVGSKWQLFIPADLAYGERGRPSIPANSTLLFDIELIAIEGGDAAK